MAQNREQLREEIYSAALQLNPGERAEFVGQACGNDEALRAEIEELLDHAQRLGSFLEEPALGAVTGSVAGEWSASQFLELGRYHLRQKIGEGGMGEVWLAEQKEPVRRRVAIKLVKAGMNTREVMARFESERQALALMDHPAIAKVFDAGSTPDGAPYFVMEYVAGDPITTYCDHHRLTTRERLELFMHVCEGVQHAHQKAIIHRDLKPSNILVAEVDGRAAPKIIDFGVAKALSQKLTENTLLTRVGMLVGTPEYMSPEQATASVEDVDTRTDVYSLGIIFYELLAGAPPLELRKVTFEEFLRRLREEDAPKPSTKIRTQDPATSTEVARKRQTELPALVKQMRGDLDSIALKALEKDRSRRYRSPSDFAADIGRYLQHEAVLAVAPSAAYRARKFARRHRAVLATAAAFILVLILAAAISIRQSLRANRETAVAQAISNFFQNDVLAQASAATQSGASATPDPHLEVHTALDRAAARIGGEFNQQPEVEAAIRDTIGQTYLDLGLYPEAEKQFHQALDLHRRALGPEDPATLRTMSRLGRSVRLQERYPESEALLSEAVRMQRRRLGPEHPDTLYSMNNLAAAYHGKGELERAAALWTQTLQARRRLLGPEHRDTLTSMNNLAINDRDRGEYSQAETLEGQALDIQRRVLGPEHPDTLMTMHNLALTYAYEGKYPQAEALASQTLQTLRHALGAEHPSTLFAAYDLADDYSYEGKYAQAEALYSETLETMRRVLGPENRYELNALSGVGSMHQRQGQYALAETYAEQALAGRRHTLGSGHPETMAFAADLVLARLSQGKFADSEPLASEAVEFYRKQRTDDWQRFRAETLLGACLAGQRKYTEAEPLLVEGYQGMVARKRRIRIPDWHYLDRAREWLVQLYQAWGKPAQAEEWRRK